MKRSHQIEICLGLVGLVCLGAASARAAETITVKGSDTMVILGQRWAEEFMKANPEIAVQVTGGGSGPGISALINGTTDICQASRPMKQTEKDQIKAKYGAYPVEIATAKDGVAVYVNEKNPIKEITSEQLKSIFTGKVTNWKEVGGSDQPIVVYSRENSSGTYVFFKEHVLENADYTPKAQTLPGTASVVNAISRDGKGIGYGGTAYAKGIKLLNVKKTADSPAVAPKLATVQDGSYPLARSLFFYTRKEPAGNMKTFVDWVLSPKGQAIVDKVGYFPIK
jgi:phosphate transport system substrate-binding protein